MIADRLLVVSGLTGDQFLKFCGAECSIVIAERGEKCAAIIETKVPLIINSFIEIDAFFGKDALKQFEMNRLVIDDNAVKIENHSPKHPVTIAEFTFCFNLI